MLMGRSFFSIALSLTPFRERGFPVQE